jgi:hypothetical protein
VPRALLVATLAALALPPPARGGVAEDLGLSEAEAVFCESEVSVIENRLRIFRAQGLSPAEQKRRNAEPQARLQECRARFRDLRRGDAEDEEVRAEVERRMPPSGGEVQRARIEREVRLERARARPPGALRPEERRLLAEEAATEAKARGEAERRRDPRFRRPALSAQLCRAQRELARLRQEQEAEARLAGVGADRNRAYYLRSEVHRVEEVAADARGALAPIGGPLPCSEPRVAEVARCLDLGPERARADEGCADDEIAALVQSVR